MIARTEIEVSITGAVQAEQQLQSVADAEREVGADGARASAGVDQLASSMRAIEQEGRRVNAGLGSVSSGLDGARDRLSSTLSAFNDLGDAFRLVGAGLAGGALFGGFADIAEVVGLMGDKFGLTALRVDQMAASQRTLSAELVARKLEVEDLGDAVDRYARSLGLASQAQLTFRERQEALRKVAAGEVTSMELQDAQAAKLTDALAAANERLEAFRRNRVDFVGEITAAGGERQFEAALQGRIDRLKADLDRINRTQLGLLGRKGADPWMDAVKDYGSAIVERAKVAVAVTKVGLQQQAQQWSRFLADTMAKMQQPPAGAEANGARRVAAKPEQTLGDIISGISGQESPLRQMETAALGGITEAGSREDMLARLFGPPQEEQDVVRERLVGPIRTALEEGRYIAETLYGEVASILAAEPEESPFSGMLEGMRTSVSQMAAEAQNVGGIMSSVVSTFTSGVGTMVTNLIVAGEAGAKSVRKTIGQALAGISAQAFGYATLLTALGTAASIGIVGLPAAPGLFAAAGVMAAAGTALALSARAMGAGAVGGSGASRSSGARGGESTPSAASTAPRSDRQAGPQPVIVYIGEDVVTRGVTSSARRQDMRGGIAEPRLAVVG
jgi:hypothetical protein